MKGICVNFLDPDLFFRFLKGRCHDNRFWAKFVKLPFNTLAFRNGFKYRNYDLQVLQHTVFATTYAVLVKIGPLTPEITQGVSVPFLDETAEIDITYQISQQLVNQTSPNYQHWLTYVRGL